MVEWLKALWPLVSSRDCANVRALATVAVKHAEQAEKKTNKARFSRVKLWATKGLIAKGAGSAPSREAFRWVRSPAGWSRATLGTTFDEDAVENESELDRGYDESAITAQPARTTVWKPSLDIVLGEQAEVDTIASGWALLWKESQDYNAVVPLVNGPQLEPIVA